jgi:hypothetical protein
MLSQSVSGYEILKTPRGEWLLNVSRVWTSTGSTSGATSYPCKTLEDVFAVIRGTADIKV